MAEKSKAAVHSKDYRARKKQKAVALGVKHLTIEVATGVEQRLRQVMIQHGFKQLDELFQTLALNLADAPAGQAAKMLKRPSASVFQISPKQARQLREFAERGEPDAEDE